MEPLRVVELFAGVGGFRLGLDKVRDHEGNPVYTTVWSNQWEPGSAKQHASAIYMRHFGGDGHCNEDLEQLVEHRLDTIPDHDLLVGGFPCQDYSVANTLNRAHGLVGKKGVLWWSIHAILAGKLTPPKYLMLENVDRLLKSPAKQRGRDFAVMLASLADLGYAVEWRVINAADYGLPQRRRRVFLLCYHYTTAMFASIAAANDDESVGHVTADGPMANAFPCRFEMKDWPEPFLLKGGLADISEDFNTSGAASPFENAGLMINKKVFSLKTKAEYFGSRQTLGEVVQPLSEVPLKFIISKKELPKWQYQKGGKSIERVSATGHSYRFSEGGMRFPDPLDMPSRTIVTSEGGASASRMTHVIEQKGRFRRLTPVELERLNGFPDDFTQGPSDAKRAFLMGNALVVDVVERLGSALHTAIAEVNQPA
jgi:DNA (cytosine-5)-methyltransferase 1